MSGARFLARGALVVALAGGVMAGAAMAQQGPESLLPPGFETPHRAPRPVATKAPARVAAKPAPATPRPAATPRPTPAPTPAPAHPMIVAQPVVPAVAPPPTPHMAGVVALPNGITSFDQLMALPQDDLDELLGLKPKYDIPPGAQRAMRQVGILAAEEGGLPPFALSHQDAGLVRALLAGNSGQLVSRWGHILLRRALASRLDAPAGFDPAEFVALRAQLLLRMGEGPAARELVQDVDPNNYTPVLGQAAFDAYVATQDFTGFCPVLDSLDDNVGGNVPQWQVERAICAAFSGDAATGFAALDHMTYVGTMPRIDMLLAQKYAGAAGKARRAVPIAWDKVADMTPWRYALTLATGLTPPASLMQDALGQAGGAQYDTMAATSPMLGLGLRADAADRGAGLGVLSATAMVDLYSQIYANDDITGPAAERALLLRDAYVADTPEARLKAMQQLWDGGSGPLQRYSRLVLTAYAAARMPPEQSLAASAPDLVSAMLAAGLDANALRWNGAVEPGSLAWGQLVLAAPDMAQPVSEGAIDAFRKADSSSGNRKSAFLLAGLAGLGRVSAATRTDTARNLSIDLDSHSRYLDTLDRAAEVGNPELVALLAGLGMQGSDWSAMTPRYLYHIVSALSRVGLGAEARMIAAEAVARG